MKKLLILAYDFPPYVSVGGLRPFSWYKYLRQMGIDPVVVTRQWSNRYGNHLDYVAPGYSDYVETEKTEFGTILRCPYRPNLANRLMLKYGEHRFRIIRKIISVWFEFFQWFFFIGSKAGLYLTAKEYLKKNHVDVIIATGDPFVLFKYASKLSSKYHIPWIADYRDPWSHDYEKSNNRWLYLFFSLLEKKYLHSASAITTVSEFLKYKIAQLHPQIPIYVFPNGYDPDAVENTRFIKPSSDCLRFAFVGTIYDWHPWKSVLRVFENYRKAHPDASFEINFYGINRTEEVMHEINQHAPHLSKHVRIFPKIPNEKLLPQLASNHVMLLFNYYSYMGTKIFDYLGLRRKIVLCYANDPEALKLKQRYYRIEEVDGISKQLQADLIEHTNAGIVVNDETHFYEVLDQLFTEFHTSGTIACHSKNIEDYSRVHQVKGLASLVKELSK